MTAKGKGIGLLEVNALLFLFVDLLESLRFSRTRTTPSTGSPQYQFCACVNQRHFGGKK